MPKSMTITKEIIIKTAFEMVRKEGFAVLSARNIAKKIGCSTQPIYWSYKNMDDLKAEVCQKALSHLKNMMCQYKKTNDAFLNLGLGYIRIAHTEPALFKAFYMDNIMQIQMTDVIPENKEVIELMKNTEDFKKMSDEEIKNIFFRSWMLVHGIASLVAVGMFVYNEEKILDILNK
jgi:transcriptional regulator, tetR family